MRILWITNILFPEAELLLSGNGEFKASGGWMLGAADALLKINNVELFVASVSKRVKELTCLKGQKITYYIIPFGKGNLNINTEYIPFWIEIKNEINPDIVHIHGTEYSHGHAYMKISDNKNVVISIQGLLSSCYKYYYYGMKKLDIYSCLTIRDIIKGSIISAQKSFKERSVIEKEMIKMCKHIIGRTSWDKANTWAINPNTEYHFCNETLRPDFYDGSQWDYHHCKKHSIFLSQAGYPLKGLHQVLKAMPLILRHYPDTIIRIAGNDIIKTNSLINKLKLTGYGLYIKKLIKKYNLNGKVIFTGNLNAKEIKQEYLNSNVFICPSTIENSPNSLGEAQILGVPCIASYVGGIADLMKGNEDNLYRFEDVEMLANKICLIFANKSKQINMIDIAKIRHNPELNSEKLYFIYKNIVDKLK